MHKQDIIREKRSESDMKNITKAVICFFMPRNNIKEKRQRKLGANVK